MADQLNATCKCPDAVCQQCHPMSDRAESHLGQLLIDTESEIDRKYRLGHLKHGDSLLDMNALQLIDEAINEAMDQIVYLRTLKEKLKQSRP